MKIYGFLLSLGLITAAANITAMEVVYVQVEQPRGLTRFLKDYLSRNVCAALAGATTGACAGMIDKLFITDKLHNINGLVFNNKNELKDISFISVFMNWFVEPKIRSNFINDMCKNIKESDVISSDSQQVSQNVGWLASWLAYLLVLAK